MSDEWYTPKHIFDAIGLTFDLDVATPCNETIHTPHIRRYCPCQDGLSREWGGLVWMNPPYSKPGPWVEKWLDHGNGICLVPMSKSKWFYNLWNSEALIVNVQPNMKFDRPDGPPKQIFLGFILAALGDQACQALLASNLGRVR